MKKSITTFVLCSIALIIHAQFPNGSLDTWTSFGTYSEPNGWATINQITTPGANTEDVNGVSGSAARLEVLTDPNLGIVGGYMELGYDVYRNGVAFTQQNINALNFTAKYNLQTGDTMYVDVYFTVNIGPTKYLTGLANRKYAGSVSTFTAYSIPITWASFGYDSLIVSVTVGNNSIGGTVGSYAVVDEFSFSLGAPAVPDSPTSLTVSDISPTVDTPRALISWTDNSDFEIHTAVERSTDINGPWAAVAYAFYNEAPETMDSTSLLFNTMYYYRAWAKNGNDSINSGYSNVDSIMFILTTVKEHPSLAAQLYPNPASNILHIANNNSDYNYQVADIQGRVLINSRSVGKETDIDISKLPKGNYFIRLQKGNVETIKRFVKE
jgi:hypothetical protein